MMQQLKQATRNSAVRPAYLWTANRYRQAQRLFTYPTTANVGRVDYDAYWDEKFAAYDGEMGAWRTRRAQVFAGMMREGDRVLDLGVGDGALLRYVIDHAGVEGYGLDISEKAVAFCQSQGLNVQQADVNEPLDTYFDAPFDYVVLSEIIEHIPDPERLLNDLRPHVRKGIIVSVPNTGFHQHRLRLLFGRFPVQWMVTPGEHLRYWTHADFLWWADQIGFEVMRAVPYEGTPGLKEVAPGLFAAAFVYLLRAH
ncbi:MAG: methionine biosynthesis protein MetW [Chloroflexota bacterium]